MTDGDGLKVAVIGVGYLGRFHAQKWATLPGCRLVGIADAVPATDIRNVEVLLLGEALPLWDMQLLTVIDAGDQTVCADVDPSQAPLPGQAIVLGDGTGAAYEATVVSATGSAGPPAVTEVQFAPALAGQLDVRSAAMQGNIVRASHGQAVSGETLGKGDSSVAGQRFTLGKPLVETCEGSGSALHNLDRRRCRLLHLLPYRV